MVEATQTKKVKSQTSKTTTKKTTTPKVEKSEKMTPEPVGTEPQVTEQVQTVKTIDTEVVLTPNDRFQHILSTLNDLKKTIAVVIEDVKKLQKDKKKTKNTNLKSGFVKQVPVTEKLASFVGIKNDDLISRVDVTKFVTDYIKTNDLQVKDNKQHFTLDEKLADLFAMELNSQIHYFKLQAHLKDHYPKQTPQVAAA